MHVHKTHQIPVGDFPHMSRFCDVLKEFEIHKFPEVDKKAMAKLEWTLDTGIPELMKMMPPELNSGDAAHFSSSALAHEAPPAYGGAAGGEEGGLIPAPSALGALHVPGGFGDQGSANPFDDVEEAPISWVISDTERQRHMNTFYGLKYVVNLTH